MKFFDYVWIPVAVAVAGFIIYAIWQNVKDVVKRNKKK